MMTKEQFFEIGRQWMPEEDLESMWDAREDPLDTEDDVLTYCAHYTFHRLTDTVLPAVESAQKVLGAILGITPEIMQRMARDMARPQLRLVRKDDRDSEVKDLMAETTEDELRENVAAVTREFKADPATDTYTLFDTEEQVNAFLNKTKEPLHGETLPEADSFSEMLARLDMFLTEVPLYRALHTLRDQSGKQTPEGFLTSSDAYYLSDGGYSRIAVNRSTGKIWLTSNSLEKVKARWENAAGLRSEIEAILAAALR